MRGGVGWPFGKKMKWKRDQSQGARQGVIAIIPTRESVTQIREGKMELSGLISEIFGR